MKTFERFLLERTKKPNSHTLASYGSYHALEQVLKKPIVARGRPCRR